MTSSHSTDDTPPPRTPPVRIPSPPRGVIRTRAQREAWALVWPRAATAPGFEAARDLSGVAAVVVYHLRHERAAGGGDADLAGQLRINLRAIAQTLGLPAEDAAIDALFARA